MTDNVVSIANQAGISIEARGTGNLNAATEKRGARNGGEGHAFLTAGEGCTSLAA
jgi:hypothetical protein